MGLTKEKIGEMLTMYRNRAGLTQNEVVEKIDFSRSTYLALESGKRDIWMEELNFLKVRLMLLKLEIKELVFRLGI